LREALVLLRGWVELAAAEWMPCFVAAWNVINTLRGSEKFLDRLLEPIVVGGKSIGFSCGTIEKKCSSLSLVPYVSGGLSSLGISSRGN
jgi:hypothetical protein